MKFKRLVVFLCLICMTCCSVFAENKFVKVVLVGDYSSGKTSIWKKMLDESFDSEVQQSESFTFSSITREDGDDILCITLWDTAGLDKYYDEVVNFTRDANFVFIVHDLYKRCDAEVEVYLSKIYRDVHERISLESKVVLVGSKYDLRHKDIVNSSKQAELLKSVAEHIPCPYVYTSAKDPNDAGIQELLNYVVKQCRSMTLPNKHSLVGSIKFNADIAESKEELKNDGCVIC